MREADVGSQSADTIKLSFTWCSHRFELLKSQGGRRFGEAPSTRLGMTPWMGKPWRTEIGIGHPPTSLIGKS